MPKKYNSKDVPEDISKTWRTVEESNPYPNIARDDIIVGKQYLINTSNNQKFMKFLGFNDDLEPVFWNKECCCYHIAEYEIDYFTEYNKDLKIKVKEDCKKYCKKQSSKIRECKYTKTVGGVKNKSKRSHKKKNRRSTNRKKLN